MKSRFAIFCIFLLLFSCKKNERELIGEFLLGDLAYTNPFQGNEKLEFSCTDGSELLFIGSGRSRILHEGYTDSDKDPYYITESDYCFFDEDNDRYSFAIRLDSRYIKSVSYGMALNVYGFHSTEPERYPSVCSYKLPLSIDNLSQEQSFYDSVLVSNKYYYNVFISPMSATGLWSKNDSVFPNEIFYNKTHGILKVNFTDSTSWELKEIIYWAVCKPTAKGILIIYKNLYAGNRK